MRRTAAVVVLVGALAGCASSSHTTSPQAKKDEAKAEQVIKKCLPSGNLIGLAKKADRQKFIQCAIPPKSQVAAEHCVTDGVLGHLPTVHRIESVLLDCIGRYA